MQRRLLRGWRNRLDPTRLVTNEQTFLAPLVAAQRRQAATRLQSAFRRFRAMVWKEKSVSARWVQREWRCYRTRCKMVEARRAAVDLTHRRRKALAMLDADLRTLEAKCQPSDDGAVAPAMRALALVRGRVLDACRERIRSLVVRAVEKATPRALERAEVRAILDVATNGLFPEADDEPMLPAGPAEAAEVELPPLS